MILILDFGSQYNQLITRSVRALGVYRELHSHKLSAEEIKQMNPKGIILSGGPHSVYDKKQISREPKKSSLDIPVLVFCYRIQPILINFYGIVVNNPQS